MKVTLASNENESRSQNLVLNESYSCSAGTSLFSQTSVT